MYVCTCMYDNNNNNNNNDNNYTNNNNIYNMYAKDSSQEALCAYG